MMSRYPDGGRAKREDPSDGGEARPRPHRAVRLAEVMEENAPEQRGKADVPSPSRAAPRGEPSACGSCSGGSFPRESCIRESCSGESCSGGSFPRKSCSGGSCSRESCIRESCSRESCSDGSFPRESCPRESNLERNTPKPPRRADPMPPVSPDGYAILSVYPEGEGETMAVVLAVPADEAKRITAGKGTAPEASSADQTDKPGQLVKVKLHLLPEQYADLGVKAGEITAERADELIEAGRLCGAIRRGAALLGYGDQSARKLAYKLTAKGIDRETAASAVAYLAAKGYIRESGTAALRAQQGVGKLWGPRRIREDLRAQGFTPDAVEEALDALSEVDWAENCAAAIRKKYGEVPADKAERQKLTAAVMRLGYDSDTARQAMRMLLREN